MIYLLTYPQKKFSQNLSSTCLFHVVSCFLQAQRVLRIVIALASMLALHYFYLWPIFVLILSFTAISDYKQSLQFQNLNEEKQNIHLEVCSDDFMWFMLIIFLVAPLGSFLVGLI